MSEGSGASPDYESLARELEAKNAELEKQVAKLESENKELRERLASLENTVSAVVARSIDVRADTGRSRWRKKAGRGGAATRARAGASLSR